MKIFKRLLTLGILGWVAGCGNPPPPSDLPPPATLKEIPLDQLRMMLKGYPGDWRQDTDHAKGIEAPGPAELPADAVLVDLPMFDAPDFDMSLTHTLADRRSRRAFAGSPVSLKSLSYLLWAVQGITGAENGLRTAPSAGGSFPLETRIIAQRVDDLAPGVYRYLPEHHKLLQEQRLDDPTGDLVTACYGQAFIADAGCTFIWSAVPARTEWKYGYIAHRMIAMEVGHACQNLYLACEAAGLGTCALLGYDQAQLDALLNLDGDEEFALYIAPVGVPKEDK